jgi:hypothetical protein
MLGTTKTIKQALSGSAIHALHSSEWRLNGGACFRQTPNSPAIFNMLKGRVAVEQLPSDYRLFEHR